MRQRIDAMPEKVRDFFEERAAICQYDAHMGIDQAEEKALELARIRFSAKRPGQAIRT